MLMSHVGIAGGVVALCGASVGLLPESAGGQGATVPSTADAIVLATGAIEHDGSLLHARKLIVDGTERVEVAVDGRLMSADEYRAWAGMQPPRVLTAAAQHAVAAAPVHQPLDLVVVLREQPAAPVAREVFSRARSGPDGLDAISARMRDITAKSIAAARGPASMPPEQERGVTAQPLADADMAERRVLAEARDEKLRQARIEIAQRIAAAVQPSQAALSVEIARLGGEVTSRTSVMNIVGVRIPAGKVGELAAHPAVARIDLDHPGQPELDNHRQSLGLTTGFWANGIDGGVHDVGVLDTGVQQNHAALSSHTFLSNMGVNDTSTHGTGMAGILASTDATFRGMAFGCDKIVVALAGSINTSMPGMDYIASTGEPENVNYSFGNGTANASDYSTTDQFFDGVIDTFGFMVSKSTGNGGFGSGSPTITHPAPAYNLMASANMNDQNTVTRTDDRIDSTSSRGPTVAGRKKPDITAPGTNSMSTHPNGGFANIGGTSSASPHTGGGVVLLLDMGVPSVKTAKAILLNTTDAMDDNNTSSTADDTFVNGSFWNRRYGWGYLNLGQAYLHGLDLFEDSLPPAPENADFRLFKGVMFTNERATLVWQRHVAYNGATFPTQIESLSDLDLTAWREETNAVLGASQSLIDNVEQIDVDSDGNVVLKVEAFGAFDPDVPLEEFGLATQENFSAASGPAFAATWVHQSTAAPNEEFSLTVQVTNTGDVDAHGVTVTLSGITVVSGANPQALNAIADGSVKQAVWTVRAAASQGLYPLSMAVSSNSYGETFTGSGNSQYEVSLTPACAGDLDGNGGTDSTDLNIVLTDFGCEGLECAGDADNDGDTDSTDLNIVLTDFGCNG